MIDVLMLKIRFMTANQKPYFAIILYIVYEHEIVLIQEYRTACQSCITERLGFVKKSNFSQYAVFS